MIKTKLPSEQVFIGLFGLLVEILKGFEFLGKFGDFSFKRVLNILFIFFL